MDHRWRRITDIFTAALEQGLARRGVFLDGQCGGDAALRAEVESLLAAHDEAGGFLDVPAAVAAGLVPTLPHEEGDSLAGQVLGPYRLERELGRGGMGVVYLAEDTRLGRKVAIKLLSSSFSRDATRRERLRLEARAAAALSHPGIATVFSLEEIEGHLCLVTEYVEGDTLRSEIEHGPLSLDLVLDTGIQVARGLAAAHAAGVVHRDLKPENIIRSRQGEVKILDFGIARIEAPSGPDMPRLTGTGAVLGTPGYMSPEQLDGADVDQRSDIFALGILLFEVATAIHPFAGPTPGSTVAKVFAADPPTLTSLDPRLPEELDAIVRTCLRRHRADRYATAMDVARDLQELREGRLRMPSSPVPGSNSGPSRPLWWWRLHQATAMMVVGALVLGVWRVHHAVQQDWTLAILLAYCATGAVNGTLRAHLWFTTAFNPADMPEQFRRSAPLMRGTDLVVAALLLVSAAFVAHSDLLLSSVIAAFGVGLAVASLIVEPATRRAAFPSGAPTPPARHATPD